MGAKPEFNVITGLNCRCPVFDWGERRQTSRQQKAYVAIQELQQSYVSDGILQEYSNAISKVEESVRQVSAAKENMELADESLELITFSYNEGRSSMTDVLQAQLSWIQAQNNLISAYQTNKMAVAEYRKVISE